MKRGISRKINLQRFGGAQYESLDVWIEDEEKSFAELKSEIDMEIVKIIKQIPQENLAFEQAKLSQPPFVSQGEIISTEQQERHLKKLKK